MSATTVSPTLATSPWHPLYRLGGWCGLIAPVLFLATVVLAIALNALATYSPLDWLTALQTNRAAALAQLAFTDLLGTVMLLPVVLALVLALRHTSPSFALLAAVMCVVGLATALTTNPNYALIHLSSQYHTAATPAEQAQILAAAESAVSTGTWSTGFLVGGFLVELALTLISIVMWRSPAFGKWAGWLGVVAHGLDTLHYVAVLVLALFMAPAIVESIGLTLLAIGGTFQLIWYPLVALKLLRFDDLSPTG